MQSVYFIGIGGSGMQPLARLTQARGFKVEGSDAFLSEETRALLMKDGIKVYTRVDAQSLQNYDTVVYSSAIKKEHYERRQALRLHEEGKLQLLHRMDFLNECLREYDPCFAIAGTHGKTSSTAMLGWLLQECGIDVNMIVGGRPLYLKHGFRIGTSKIGVYETDESDGSFLRSQAKLRLVLNIDKDHLEYYNTMEALTTAFFQFCLGGSITAINANDSNLADFLIKSLDLHSRAVLFSHFADTVEMRKFISTQIASNHTRLTNQAIYTHYTSHFQKQGDKLTVFCYHINKPATELQALGELSLISPGRHFAINALGVLALVLEAQKQGHIDIPNVTPIDMIQILNQFPGVERRLQNIGVIEKHKSQSQKQTPNAPKGNTISSNNLPSEKVETNNECKKLVKVQISEDCKETGKSAASKAVLIYDDYAHHPTEIQVCLQALRSRMNKAAHLIAIFQPHRYSRVATLYRAFAQSLYMADQVFLLPIYSANEEPRLGIDSTLILNALQNIGHTRSKYISETDKMKEVLASARPGDIVIGLGAGDISQLLHKSMQQLLNDK